MQDLVIARMPQWCGQDCAGSYLSRGSPQILSTFMQNIDIHGENAHRPDE